MRVLLPLVLLTFVLAGCSSGEDSSTSLSSTPSTSTAMMDHSAKTIDVSLEGNAFVNSSVTIYEGDSVLWTHNDGTSGHSVTADDGAFDSHENCVVAVLPSPVCMTDGQTFKHTFAEVGSFGYFCRAHPGMTGTVEVLAHSMM